MVENIEKISGLSKDIELDEREKLRAVFPQCFNDGKLDIDKLLNLCGEYIDNDFEKYKFEWSGKAECYKLAGKRSTGTLRPCPKESVNFAALPNHLEGEELAVPEVAAAEHDLPQAAEGILHGDVPPARAELDALAPGGMVLKLNMYCHGRFG